MVKLDKNLIKKNFEKSIKTYEDNAIVQKTMAKTLIKIIKENKNSKKKFNNVLEIGSYSGILTREFLLNFQNFNSYLALDIVNSFEFIKNLDKRIKFYKGDFEDFHTEEKFDLIISNAAFQWANDFKKTIEKYYSMLEKNGILAITTFSKENMFEIRDVFNIGLNYFKIQELKEMFKNAYIVEDMMTLKFKNSIDILKHLKYSGVNSIKNNRLNYREIKEKLKILEDKYQNTITYKPTTILLIKN